MKATLTILVSALIVLLFFPQRIDACSCLRLKPCEAFGYASAVFIGRMIEGTEKVSEYTKDGKTVSYEAGRVRFAVEEAFKGVNATEITIRVVNLRDTSCEGTSVGRGERYLVYAESSDSGWLTISPCSPTTLLRDAKEDLEFLRSLPKPGSGGRVYGRVSAPVGSSEILPLAGIPVVAVDEAHQKIQVLTDKDGNYEFKGLKPGKYRFEPVLPEHYIPDYQERPEVEVSDRGCFNEFFLVMVNSRLSGRVVDSAGRTAQADLTLVSMDNDKRELSGYADDDGEFEIVGIPPGRYLLYLNILSA